MRSHTTLTYSQAGAVLAWRLVSTIKEELRMHIYTITFWVDSQTVLRWIHSSTYKFPSFVANRIGEILERTSAGQWRRKPGILNPADDCSPKIFLQNIGGFEDRNSFAYQKIIGQKISTPHRPVVIPLIIWSSSVMSKIPTRLMW